MTTVNEYWYGRGRINNQILKILIIRFHPYNLQLPLYTVALFALLQLHHITPPPRPPLHWQLPQSTYTLQSHFFRGAFATLPHPPPPPCAVSPPPAPYPLMAWSVKEFTPNAPFDHPY